MATTFTEERKTYQTATETATLRTEGGTATIGETDVQYYGQIFLIAENRYVGDYSRLNLSVTDSAYLVEAATLVEQLSTDIAAKQAELYPADSTETTVTEEGGAQ